MCVNNAENGFCRPVEISATRSISELFLFRYHAEATEKLPGIVLPVDILLLAMANYLYVDNSNVWIEGMHVAAAARGFAPDVWAAVENKICDYMWKIDFGRLHEFAGGKGKEIGRARLYGSRPPANDSLWKIAKERGFEVFVADRNVANKEKKIDTTITRDITKDSYEFMKPGQDEVTLVAGDGDYVPVAEDLIERGCTFDVAFWDHANRELKDACSNFISLNQYLDYLALHR